MKNLANIAVVELSYSTKVERYQKMIIFFVTYPLNYGVTYPISGVSQRQKISVFITFTRPQKTQRHGLTLRLLVNFYHFYANINGFKPKLDTFAANK
jgi:hypothetical protein